MLEKQSFYLSLLLMGSVLFSGCATGRTLAARHCVERLSPGEERVGVNVALGFQFGGDYEDSFHTDVCYYYRKELNGLSEIFLSLIPSFFALGGQVDYRKTFSDDGLCLGIGMHLIGGAYCSGGLHTSIGYESFKDTSKLFGGVEYYLGGVGTIAGASHEVEQVDIFGGYVDKIGMLDCSTQVWGRHGLYWLGINSGYRSEWIK
jgi:hypothetical protein